MKCMTMLPRQSALHRDLRTKDRDFFFSSKATDLCDTDHLPKMVKSKIILSPGPHIYRYF